MLYDRLGGGQRHRDFYNLLLVGQNCGVGNAARMVPVNAETCYAFPFWRSNGGGAGQRHSPDRSAGLWLRVAFLDQSRIFVSGATPCFLIYQRRGYRAQGWVSIGRPEVWRE